MRRDDSDSFRNPGRGIPFTLRVGQMAGRSTQTGAPQARRYLSPQEFSGLSGLSLATVRRYLRNGKLPYRQPAGHRGRILIPADALDLLLAATSPEEPSQAPQVPPTTPRPQPPVTPTRPSGPRPKWTRLARAPHAQED